MSSSRAEEEAARELAAVEARARARAERGASAQEEKDERKKEEEEKKKKKKGDAEAAEGGAGEASKEKKKKKKKKKSKGLSWLKQPAAKRAKTAAADGEAPPPQHPQRQQQREAPRAQPSTAVAQQRSTGHMIEVVLDDRLGKKVRVKCNSDDTIGTLKLLAAAQLGTRPEKIKKWYEIYKDHIRLDDYEIKDGMGLELYYQ